MFEQKIKICSNAVFRKIDFPSEKLMNKQKKEPFSDDRTSYLFLKNNE